MQKSLAWCAVLSAAFLNACGSGGEELGNRWNVLLVTLDTTRADHLSCYGYEKETTPNLDALASDGARFVRAVSTAGITPMSHSSILTGLNNYKHGMRVFYSPDVTHKLKDSVDTLPEILGGYGWQTAAMVSSYPVSEVYGLNQGFDTFDTGLNIAALDLTKQQKHETEWFDGPSNDTQRRGDATVDQALGWLDRTGDDPWCLWVHMFDVHDYSIVPPAAFMEPFGIDQSAGEGLQRLDMRAKMYDPELQYMDLQVGRLLDWVKGHGQWDETVVVVTADHGQGLLDGFARHKWQKHRLLYDWCLRVPMILHVPGETRGQVVESQVRTIDILPTLLDALALPSVPTEGLSMLGLMRGETEAEPRLAYADALNLEDKHSPQKMLPPNCIDNLFSVSDGRWKMIWHQREPRLSELFDLETDPGELQNVANLHPNRMMRFKRYLDERDAMVFEAPSSVEDGPDSETLNALGYGGDDSSEASEASGGEAPMDGDAFDSED